MSIRESVTYQEVLNTIRTYIINSCANVGSRSLPSRAVSGKSYTPISHSTRVGTVRCNMSFSHNVPTNVATGTLDNQITEFCTNIGLNNTTRNYVIDDANFDKFMRDIIVFMNTKLVYLLPYAPSSGSVGDSNNSNKRVEDAGEAKYLVYSTANAINTAQLEKITPVSSNSTSSTLTYSVMKSRIDSICSTIRASAKIVAISCGYSITY